MMVTDVRLIRTLTWLVIVPLLSLAIIFIGLFAYGAWLVESPWQDQDIEYSTFKEKQDEYSDIYLKRLETAEETENTDEILSVILYIQQKDLELRNDILNINCERLEGDESQDCLFYSDLYTAYKNRRILGVKIHDLDLTEEDHIQAFNEAVEDQNSRIFKIGDEYINEDTPVVSPLLIYSQVELQAFMNFDNLL